MKKAAITGVAMAGILALSASADTIIGFSFTSDGDSSTHPQSGYLEGSELAGAPGVRVGNWNNLLGGVDDQHPTVAVYDGVYGDTDTVLYEDGTAVGGGFTFSSQVGFSDRDSGSFSNDREMFNGVKDSFGGNFSITLSNIPFSQYDIYCYMRDDGDQRVGMFTIGGTTLYARGGLGTPADDGTGYILSTDNDGGTVAADFDQGNYVRFTNLTGSSITLATDGVDIGNLARNKVAGIQIVAIPEPTTLALLALGSIALSVRRRR